MRFTDLRILRRREARLRPSPPIDFVEMKIAQIILLTALIAHLNPASLAATAAGLRISSARQLPEGDIELKLDVQPEHQYVIEASTDFQNWTAVHSDVATSNQLEFIDRRTLDFVRRYYRAVETVIPGNDAANDQFTNSLTITGASLSITGSNVGATAEPGEPQHADFDAGHQSVWWSWTAPGSGHVVLSTVGTYFDTLLAVYTGDAVDQLTTVAKNRYLSKLLTFQAVAGTTYRIAVDGNFDDSGIIHLSLDLTPPSIAPAPDDIASSSVFLDETSDFNVPLRLLHFDSSAASWTETDSGFTNLVDGGPIASYEPDGPNSVLRLTSVRGEELVPLTYVFHFTTPTTGTYTYTQYGELRGSGKFSNFHSLKSGMAPESISRLNLVMTRLTTSIGPAGQTHFFTLIQDGRFHDSDGVENLSGTYTYDATGSTGHLQFTYSGPPEVSGDSADIEMHFLSPDLGTYVNEYTRNDGTKIRITGEFIAEYSD